MTNTTIAIHVFTSTARMEPQLLNETQRTVPGAGRADGMFAMVLFQGPRRPSTLTTVFRIATRATSVVMLTAGVMGSGGTL